MWGGAGAYSSHVVLRGNIQPESHNVGPIPSSRGAEVILSTIVKSSDEALAKASAHDARCGSSAFFGLGVLQTF